MKKVLLCVMLFAFLGLAASAQKADIRVAVGANILDNDVFATLELGGTNGKHSYGVVVESNDPEGTFAGSRYDERQYFAGFKYLHATSVGQTANFVLGATALMHLASDHDIRFRPEAGVQINFGQNVGVLGTIGFPIVENQNGLFQPVRLQAGAQLVFRF